jgi:hypothetical protein
MSEGETWQTLLVRTHQKSLPVLHEFGFDMVQVAKNRYASQQYHDFIGFKVSKSLLERVFRFTHVPLPHT